VFLHFLLSPPSLLLEEEEGYVLVVGWVVKQVRDWEVLRCCLFLLKRYL